MDKLKILVVEDDALDRQVMAENLGPQDVDFVENADAAVRRLEGGRYDLCFIDLQLGKEGDCSGLKLIPLAAAQGVYSVVMSGHDSDAMVAKAHELGCKDFYAKGNQEANVSEILAKFLRRRSADDADRIFTEQFITEDPDTRAAVLGAVRHSSNLPVMILGPSGTGKTCLARLIHERSGRQGDFVKVNCSAFTDDLLEAELFGHKKGAFTGATEDRKGKLAQAHEGTLFLDEIGTMSHRVQASLLNAIEERCFYPVGADQPEFSDFRVASATWEDIQELVAMRKLRFDFLQRTHGAVVSLKPLAQRKGDIMPLVKFFTRSGKRLAFTVEAKACLLGHSWPGNARELKKLVELLSAEPGGPVTGDQVRQHLSKLRVAPPSGSRSFVPESQYRCALERGLDAVMDRIAAEIVRRNLAENGGRKVRTLASLRISTRRLYSALRSGAGEKREDGADGAQA